MTSVDEKFFLGRSCDASSAKHGRGRWQWANGGFIVKFADGSEFRFHHQDAPVDDNDCYSLD